LLINIKSNSTLFYYKTALVAIILTMTITPLLWVFSQGNNQWLLIAMLLWALGSIVVFHPFIGYLYPQMLTKVGVFLLTSILTSISIWFNVSIITFLLSPDYIYYALLDATLSQISLFGWFYMLLATTLISNIKLSEDNI